MQEEFGDTIEVTVDDFRQSFPEFTQAKYPDAVIQNFIDQSSCYVSDRNCGIIRNKCRKLAIMLMIAHLLILNNKAVSSNGLGTTGVSTGATLDMISLTFAAPPFNNSLWKSWIWSTPYGQRLYGLLMAKAPAPFYMFGTRQRLFRI